MQVQKSEKNEILSESTLLGFGLKALRPDSLRRARELACRANPSHAWSRLGDMEALEALGLVSVSKPGGTCKLTLAALLLLGRTELLQRIVPGREVQVTAQLLDPEGYDYHARLQGNLLEAYEYLMAFVARNLPEGDAIPRSSREGVRELLFREIFSNLLAHRDYSVAVPSRLVFQKERLTFENPSRPVKGGLVDLARRESRPPNPLIYSFLKEIGLIRDGESGFGNLLRYGEGYFGTQILAFDRDIFKIIATSSLDFPVSPSWDTSTMQDSTMEIHSMQDASWGRNPSFAVAVGSRTRNMQGEITAMQDEVAGEVPADRIRRILSYCESPRNREEIQRHIGLNNRDHFRKEVLLPLLRQGLLVATVPDKPNSPKQQYRTAPAFVSREP